MPSAQFFIDLHEYINRGGIPQGFRYGRYTRHAIVFYSELLETESSPYSIDAIRRCWKLARYYDREFLLMAMDIVRFMAEDDEPLTIAEFTQYWRSLDEMERRWYRRNFPRARRAAYPK